MKSRASILACHTHAFRCINNAGSDHRAASARRQPTSLKVMLYYITSAQGSDGSEGIDFQSTRIGESRMALRSGAQYFRDQMRQEGLGGESLW